MDSSLEYACKRLQELESLLLVDVPETVWPAEVSMVFAQIEKAGTLPAHCKRTRFSSTHFLRFPGFQPSAGILPASGYSGIRGGARRYIQPASAL